MDTWFGRVDTAGFHPSTWLASSEARSPKRLRRLIAGCALLALMVLPGIACADLSEFQFIGIHGGKEYYVSTASMTWDAANALCSSISNGHLATISGDQENDFVAHGDLNGGHSGLWIGLTSSGGSWTWVNQETGTYRNWDEAYGQPNNGGETAAGVNPYGYINPGYWHDQNSNATLLPAVLELEIPAFEIMYVFPEQQGYQWNGDEVRIHARVKSNCGSGNLQIRGGCSYFLESQMWLLEPQCFSLSAGEQYEAVFVTYTPPCPCEVFHCAKDIDISIRLEDAGGNLLTRVIDEDEFILTSLTDEQITYYEQNINECWLDPGMRCWAQVAGVIPYLGIISSLELFADDMCRAGLMDRNGDTAGSGTAAFSAYAGAGFSIIELALAGAQSALELLNRSMFSWIELAVAGMETRFECVRDFLHTLIYGSPGQLSKAISGSAAVDSLAYWFRAGLDSTGVDIADMLFVNGMCEIVVEADSSWAHADSTGLMGVRMDAISDTLSMTTVASDVRRVMSLSGANANNEACFTLRSQSDQEVCVGLLHRTGNHDLMYYRWPSLSMNATSVATLRVASDLTALYVKLDDNEDGRCDRWVYAEGTGVTGVPSVVAPQLHQNYPNPFNPQTTITFELPEQGAVTLRVFDVAGRLVRVLVDGEIYQNGRHEAIWSGRNDAGRQVASGTYFYRLEAGDFRETKRMVLVK